MDTKARILEILDGCSARYFFPVLDNGYYYLAASRLSLYRSTQDWALVIEVFGFSPRAGCPDVNVSTFASRLRARDTTEQYMNAEAHQNYLTTHPHDESRTFFPCDGDWQDPECDEWVAGAAHHMGVRGGQQAIPSREQYAAQGIDLENRHRVNVFELCRYLAAIRREDVLASETERRCSVPPELAPLLVLDEWHHPDLAGGESPGESQTFQQLASVLETGHINHYKPSVPPNNHWCNWPEAGRL